MLPPDSFSFEGVNFYERWGIKVIAARNLLGGRRGRRVVVPHAHGQHRMGPGFLQEKEIDLDCQTARGALPLAELDEMSALLSRQGWLELWDMPGRRYLAERNLQPVGLEVAPRQAYQRFSIRFVCHPFSFGARFSATVAPGMGELGLGYKGTAPSPLEITAPGGSTVYVGGRALRVGGYAGNVFVDTGKRVAHDASSPAANLVHLVSGDWPEAERGGCGVRVEGPGPATVSGHERFLI